MTAEETLLKVRGLRNLEFDYVLDVFIERHFNKRLSDIDEEFGGREKLYQNYEVFRRNYQITREQHLAWWPYIYKLLKNRYRESRKLTEMFIFGFNIDCLPIIKD